MSTEATPLATPESTVPPKLERVYDLLVQAYGKPDWCPDGDALGGLLGTILSQHTSDVNSGRAYAQLVATFPTWEAVRDAPVEQVAQAIRVGGLANLKAQRIQEVLRVLTSRLNGVRAPTAADEPLSLDFLVDWPLAEARSYLRSLPGVGPKTAACVLLFSLGMAAFPVDTHVQRVSKRLGLIGTKVSADQAHAVFESVLPGEWAFPLHVNLIRHGRRVCHAQRPACERCPLRLECTYYAGLSTET
ncbi:MAG TPA: endonuclease III [Ktedonobacterales bacterium]|nr:endonuclease III [Ktedonobacterales bacterium]